MEEPTEQIIEVREQLDTPQKLTPSIQVKVHPQMRPPFPHEFGSAVIVGKSPSDFVADLSFIYYQTPSSEPQQPQVYQPELEPASNSLLFIIE